mgnify:CR=1 FL=1
MVSIKKSAIVLYSREEMFALVDNVEEYENFLPWCGGTEIIKKSEKITKASIKINYHGVKQTFTTENNKTFPEIPFTKCHRISKEKYMARLAMPANATVSYKPIPSGI